MNILAALKNEQRRLLAHHKSTTRQLDGLRQAIVALNGGRAHHAPSAGNGSGSKLRGKKLSKAHVKAIKAGLARRAKEKAAGKS